MCCWGDRDAAGADADAGEGVGALSMGREVPEILADRLAAPPCRFNDGLPAVARFSTPTGCVCYPDDREQDLCGQHVIKGGMGDDATIIKIYFPNLARQLGIA